MVRLLAERYDTKSNVNLGGFQSQLQASYVSSQTRYNETVCLWMTYVCVYVLTLVWVDYRNTQFLGFQSF